MKPYYADESVTLYHGDALEVMRTLPDQSVNSCVTSPPYFRLRDYGIEGQYGLEGSLADYVETMRGLFAQVRRVLAEDGTLWLNLGDSYAGDKNLLGVPWRVAFELQGDGWIIRNAIIWNKPNAMPEPTADRVSSRYEVVFLLSKKPQYWFDLDVIRVPAVQAGRVRRDKIGGNKGDAVHHSPGSIFTGSETANPGDVWSIPTQPFSEAHFAVMPAEVAKRCILAGCKPGGVVLDPFSGSGTTGMVAQRLGRKYVGIDLNRDYLDLSLRTRLQQAALDFGEVS